MKLFALILTLIAIACFSQVSLAQDTAPIKFAPVKVTGKPSPVIPDGATKVRCEAPRKLEQGGAASTVKVCSWSK